MQVELYFDFSCPYAYLASEQIEEICRRAGASLIWKPMLLGGVFRAIGEGDGPMKKQAAVKTAHTVADAHRWARARGIPLSFPAAHPMRTVRALRVLLALPEAVWPAAIHAIYRAYWVESADITRDDVIEAALLSAGVPIGDAFARADSKKDELRARTDEAVARGVFGAPAFFTNGIFLWGQDRLHWLEAVLAGWNPDSDLWKPPSLPASQPPSRLSFYFDFSSPFAYLGSTQIERLGHVTWRPLLLGALFKNLGTPDVPLFAMSEAKRRYTVGELGRWARWWQVPFRFTTRFPIRTVNALRCVLAANDPAPVIHRLFRAAWVDDLDLGDDATLRRLVGDALVDRTRDPAIKQALVDSTAAAQAAGVFGVPTTGIGSELYWGQDRLDLIAATSSGGGSAPSSSTD